MVDQAPASLGQRLYELQMGLEAAGRALEQMRSEYARTVDGTPLRITPRQAQILELIAAGLPDKDIARRLGISRCTLRTHLDRFFRLNGIHDRAGAAAKWVRTSALY
jgi:DNA-binding NarL/FixJ family response regulator